MILKEKNIRSTFCHSKFIFIVSIVSFLNSSDTFSQLSYRGNGAAIRMLQRHSQLLLGPEVAIGYDFKKEGEDHGRCGIMLGGIFTLENEKKNDTTGAITRFHSNQLYLQFHYYLTKDYDNMSRLYGLAGVMYNDHHTVEDSQNFAYQHTTAYGLQIGGGLKYNFGDVDFKIKGSFFEVKLNIPFSPQIVTKVNSVIVPDYTLKNQLSSFISWHLGVYF